jgi:beta-glucosidase-like glycosyl hydrolase
MGATLFPQQINLAASFDREHALTMGRVMAKVRGDGTNEWMDGWLDR